MTYQLHLDSGAEQFAYVGGRLYAMGGLSAMKKPGKSKPKGKPKIKPMTKGKKCAECGKPMSKCTCKGY